MEDFYYAGGLRALLAQLATVPGALHLDRPTASGGTFGEQLAGAEVYNDDVIRAPANALSAEGGVAVLRGNLAPDGAVIKHIAAEPRLLKHTGPAVVFDSYTEMQAADQRPGPEHHRRLGAGAARTPGRKGGPGMPEYGMLPDPRLPAHAGGPGHGPDLRRPDERDQLRGLRAARGAGGVRRAARWPWSAPAT